MSQDQKVPAEKLVRSSEASTDPTLLSSDDLDSVAGGLSEAPQCAIVNNGMTFVHDSYYLSAES
jgi:hypothetical protein